MVGDQHARPVPERPSLVPEKPRRPDDRLDLFQFGVRHRFGVGPPTEEFRRHLVDANVGALGGENRRRQQLPGRLEVQFTPSIRIGLIQQVGDREDPGSEFREGGVAHSRKVLPPMNSRSNDV